MKRKFTRLFACSLDVQLRRFFYFVLLAITFSTQAVLASAKSHTPFPAVFSYLTVSDGLASNSISAIVQDNYGFVWIASSRGLNRYDGHQCRLMNQNYSLYVTSLCVQNDTIWIGTDHGLFLYSHDADSIQKCKFPSMNTASDMNVTDLSVDKKGILWVTTSNKGIFRLNTKKNKLEAVSTSLGDVQFSSIFVDGQGRVWASVLSRKTGVMKYDSSKKRFLPYTLKYKGEGGEKLTNLNVSATVITQSSDGMLWMGTWEGDLYRLNPTTGELELKLSAARSSATHIHSLQEWDNGSLLIGSDSGLSFYNCKTGEARLYSRNTYSERALSDNFVYPIMRDREGGLWIGTYYGGVNYTHPSITNFTSYAQASMADNVTGNVINHFCEDGNGNIWLASDDGGLSMLGAADGKLHKVNLSGGDERHNVHALCVYRDKLLVGTYAQGMCIVDVNTHAITHIPYFLDENNQVIDMTSYAMYVDKQSRIWVGTFNAVCTYNPDTQRFKARKDIGASVLDMCQDSHGTMWFASDGEGLWAYGNGDTNANDSLSKGWKQYLDFDKEAVPFEHSVSVYDIYEDKHGALWVATSIGLFRYKAKTDSFESVPLSAFPQHVLGISGDGDDLWLTTSNGLCCYSLKQQKVTQVVKNGGNICSIDFMPAAIFRSSQGVIYIGTTSGFFSFVPHSMTRNSVVPKVMFTGLEVCNKPVRAGSEHLSDGLSKAKELRFSYRDTVIRIYFSAMSFVQPYNNTYFYYLEGFDSDWTSADNHHSAIYTNLSPGTYTLHVRAQNNDGVESPESTLLITITPPFYWNTTAQIIYVLLILALIYYIVRRIINKQKVKHVAEIREINTKKEDEIREINTQKENAIKEISIQKEQEIQEISTQKEQEIQEINIQKEQEVHDARIKFMTITPKDQEFLDKIESVIEHNFSNTNLSVEFLAAEIGVSRTGLFTKLKSLADVTPNEMIQVIRLKHAATLLQSKQYRVNEVCYMVGFSSPSYFAKCFQKQYGTTPAKYVKG